MLSSNYSCTALHSQHPPPLQTAEICAKESTIPRTAIIRGAFLLPLAFHAAWIGQPRCQGTPGTAAVPLLHSTLEHLLDLGYMLTEFLIINEGNHMNPPCAGGSQGMVPKLGAGSPSHAGLVEELSSELLIGGDLCWLWCCALSPS